MFDNLENAISHKEKLLKLYNENPESWGVIKQTTTTKYSIIYTARLDYHKLSRLYYIIKPYLVETRQGVFLLIYRVVKKIT